MKMKFLYTLSFLILTNLLSQQVFSQQGANVTVRDLETWTSGSVTYKASEKWSFNLNEEMRLNNNSSDVDQFFTELSFKNKFYKSMYWGLGLRLIQENDNQGEVQGYENHFRYNLDLGYSHNIDRLKLNYRFRYQSKNELGITKEEGDVANKHLRFKLGTTYNIKNWKFDPKLSAEIRNELDNEYMFDRYRVTLGTSYKTKKYGEVDIFYRVERELNKSYPLTTNVIGLKYNFTIKRKK